MTFRTPQRAEREGGPPGNRARGAQGSLPSDPRRVAAVEGWDQRTPADPDLPMGRGTRYALVFLVLLTAAMVCVAAFLVFRLVSPDTSPVAWLSPGRGATATAPQPEATSLPASGRGTAQVAVDPTQGASGTLVTVTGSGWWPGEPVFVFLQAPDDDEGRGYSYAAGVADEGGGLQTAFTFPNEQRWIGKERADVIARGSRSGFEATTTFLLLQPTASPTPSPLPSRPTTEPTSTPTPTAPPPPSPTPTPVAVITEWRGEYFANSTLSGPAAVVRNDSAIDFDWASASPGLGVPADEFSVRWSRDLPFSEGRYRFTAAADDGIRFWLDGQLLVDQWQDQPFTAYTVDVVLTGGSHSLLVEYYDGAGLARALLAWTRFEPTPTPTPTLPPTATPTATPSPTSTPIPLPTLPPPAELWRAEFFDNPGLEGEPVLVDEVNALSFDWGAGSPGPSVPADFFSARWTRAEFLEAGAYRLTVWVDDGVRVWVDGILVIDEWHVVGGEPYVVDIELSSGVHRQRVEFLEQTEDARIRFESERLADP